MKELAVWLKENPARNALMLFEHNPGTSTAGYFVFLTEPRHGYDEVAQGFDEDLEAAARLALDSAIVRKECSPRGQRALESAAILTSG